MSDDEVDLDLLELLRQRLGISAPQDGVPRDTGVLKNAEYIYSNAIDVHVDMYGTKGAAVEIYKAMQERGYSTQTWSTHELHPKPSEGFSEVDIVNFVFTMDLLNFSFWSELPAEDRYQVEYRDQRWTGYNSLVACLRRALDEGIPFTTPRFWTSSRCTEQIFNHVFRGATREQIPLLGERVAVLKEASTVLRESFADEEEEDFVVTGAVADSAATHSSETIDQSSNTHAIALQEPHDHSAQQGSSLQATANDELEQPPPPSQPTEALAPDDLPEIDTASGEASDSASLAVNANVNNGNERTMLVDAPVTVHVVTDLVNDHAQTDVSERFSPARYIASADMRPDHTVLRLIEEADRSAGKLVNLLAKHFDCFRDETRFDGRTVRIMKRAQIFVADLWAALNNTGYGRFDDIDHLTMFADYRVPQSLHSLGVLTYSPPLDYHIRNLRWLEPGHSWEVQLRGCSIWAVELIRREILRAHPEATTSINAVLIDFFLYDLAKERELQGQHAIPHHRTRSIWY